MLLTCLSLADEVVDRPSRAAILGEIPGLVDLSRMSLRYLASAMIEAIRSFGVESSLWDGLLSRQALLPVPWKQELVRLAPATFARL